MTLFSRISYRFKSISVFDIAIRAFLIYIPFSSFISVFLTHGLDIPGVSFIKEGILVIAGLALMITYFVSHMTDRRYILRLTRIDILILVYMLFMILVTCMTTGMRGLVFGGRYDFAFLLTYLIVYHGYALLAQPLSYYMRIFLISSGCMLLISGLLKWPFHEDLLLYFGYSGNPSAWDFGGAPPIFHGIDGANVRRFQGLLDGPNTMGAFLIIFSGILAYFLRFLKEWYFAIALVLIGLCGMVLYTYSRSAAIGLIFAYLIVLISSLRSLWRVHRRELIAVCLIIGLLLGAIGVVFSDRAMAIIGRAGSTQGHSERMMTGIRRTIEHPLGQGLGSAGPAYRYVNRLTDQKSGDIAELDRYYIPESWYIQQFIEGGYIGGILFLLIMLMIFLTLFSIHPILGGLFAGVGTMNLFLHTFESSVVSLSLFTLVGLIIANAHHAKK